MLKHENPESILILSGLETYRIRDQNYQFWKHIELSLSDFDSKSNKMFLDEHEKYYFKMKCVIRILTLKSKNKNFKYLLQGSLFLTFLKQRDSFDQVPCSIVIYNSNDIFTERMRKVKNPVRVHEYLWYSCYGGRSNALVNYLHVWSFNDSEILSN